MRRSFGVSVVILWLASCGSDSGPIPAGDIVLRWIDTEPTSLLQSSELSRLDPVFEWGFSRTSDPSAWELVGIQDARISNGRLRVRSANEDPRLVRACEFDADSVHRIDVVMSVPGTGAVELSWMRAGESYSPRRSIQLQPEDGRGSTVTTFTFDMRSHPEWRGTISGLRLDPTDRPAETVELESITGGLHVVDAAKLTSATERAWKVVLGREARNARIALPGTQLERRLELPDGAMLSFAFGLQPGMVQPVRFSVLLDAGGQVDRLFTRILDPIGGRGDQWHAVRLNLGSYAGQEVTLRLETSAEGDLDPTNGLPVWGNPEVSGAVRQPGPNVLLICLDTLRADRLSSYGYDLPTSRNMDAWSAESATLFRNTVATAPWTLPSHVSMFTGLDSMRHGINHYRPAPPSLDMVAEIMRRAGYTTAAMTGGGYLRPEFGFAQGFDSFRFWRNSQSSTALLKTIESAIIWLSEHRHQRFFLFFHTYEIHSPHRRRQPHFNRFCRLRAIDPPDSAIELRRHDWEKLRVAGDYFVARRPGSAEWDPELTEAEVELTSLMYDSAIAYADVQIQRLLEQLDRLGIRDNTVVIITSDHGEALGEDGRAGHSYLDEYNVLVPLMVALPDGLGAGRIVDQQVRLTDLTPTILDAVGLPANKPMDGVSLRHLIEGEPSIVPEEAWTYAASNNHGVALRLNNRLKYMLTNAAWSQIAGQRRLYDLETDPEESHDLAAADPRTADLDLRTRDAILDQHRGYRLTIGNAGPDMLVGRLGGVLANRARVKTADLDCRCIRWRTGERPTFALRPGNSVTLLVETPEVAHAAINLRVVDEDKNTRARLRHRFNLDGSSLPVAWSFNGDTWEREPNPSEAPHTGFIMWIEGDLEPGVPTEVPQDQQMREQLRALGYVE